MTARYNIYFAGQVLEGPVRPPGRLDLVHPIEVGLPNACRVVDACNSAHSIHLF